MTDNVVARLRKYMQSVMPGQWDWTWTDEGDDAPHVHVEIGNEVVAHNVLDTHHAVLIVNAINALPALLDVVDAASAFMATASTDGYAHTGDLCRAVNAVQRGVADHDWGEWGAPYPSSGGMSQIRCCRTCGEYEARQVEDGDA